LGFGLGYNNFWVLSFGITIFGFWVYVLGFGITIFGFWGYVLGFGIKIFEFWVYVLGIIPNSIPKPKTHFFLGTNVWLVVANLWLRSQEDPRLLDPKNTRVYNWVWVFFFWGI